MFESSFYFCLPTRGIKVPGKPEWIHEVKYDGYRLRVERDGDRVRLITRGSYNWTKRYPWIVEAALKNRHKQFVLDGEAVVLGVDGISDFNALRGITRCSSTPSTSSRWTATTCVPCPRRCARRTSPSRCISARADSCRAASNRAESLGKNMSDSSQSKVSGRRLETSGFSRAAPATARTLSSDMETSATMICQASDIAP